MQAVDQHISSALKQYADRLETYFKCDVLAYVGPIYPAAVTQYREVMENVKAAATKPEGHNPDKLVIVLTTPGGVVETVEKMVNLTRRHYLDVSFVVPDMAMSAGTVWCMSGDRIWMDYGSSLGPIDPQVQSSNGSLVPALGYLDKVNEFIAKLASDALTTAEAILLQRVDLAELRRYEQARDLSTSLLKQWLVAYKFKNWSQHRTTNPGTTVTEAEKEARAEQIAKDLADNKRWHSHSRMIGMKCLQHDLRLEIDDYTDLPELRDNVKTYNALLTEHADRQGSSILIHSARG